MKRQIYINTFLGLLSKNSVNILIFFAGIFLIRFLDTEDYGKYAYVSSAVGIFGVLVNFGLNNYFIREMSREPDKAKEHLSIFLGLQLTFAFIIFLVIVIIAFFHQDPDLRFGFLVFGLAIFVASLFSPFSSILGAKLRNDIAYVEMFVQALVQLGLTSVGFIARMPLLYYMSIPFAASSFRLLHNLFDNWRKGWVAGPSFDRQKWMKALKQGLPFGILTGINIIYMKMDILMFASLENNYWTAVYSVASKLIYMLVILPTVFVENLYPVFSRAKIGEKDQYKALLSKFTLYNWVLCLPLLVGGVMESRGIIELLFGERYLNAILPFCIYLALPLLVALYIASNHYLIAHHKTWFLVKVAFFGLIVNFFGNLGVLLRYDGVAAMVGSSSVTIFTEILLCGFSLYYIWKEEALSLSKKRFMKTIYANIIMAGFLYFLPYEPVLARISLAAIVYAISIWFIGVLEHEDREKIKNLLLRRK